MIRISDIMKKAKEPKPKEEKIISDEPSLKSQEPRSIPSRPAPREPVSGNPEPSPAFFSYKEETKNGSPERKKEASVHEDISIASILNKPASALESEKLYQDMISLAQTAVAPAQSDYAAFDINRLVTQIEKVIEQLTVSNEKLLMSAFLSDATATNRLFSHSVNTCMYAIEIALAQGYPRLHLIEMGVLAFLNETDMVKFLFSSSQKAEFSRQEKEDMKKYASAIARIFSCINGFCNLPNDTLPHDGEGLEDFLSQKSESLSRYAKLIHVVDFYETMTHRGIYGDRHSSLEAVQEILNNKEKFEQAVIKVLIEKVGIFPIGSFIKLSTKETAQVIRLNKGKPLRPIIKIVLDAEGKKLSGDKMLDLSQHPTIYIKEEEKPLC